MKSLQDYIDIYTGIVTNLNIQGTVADTLVQMLANASYISEVENVTYMNESSLDRATLMNSKIQHCADQMYSVFRGTCPRVIMNFVPTRYFQFNMYDEIVTSSTFKIYYAGYFNSEEHVSGDIPEFIQAPIRIAPSIDVTEPVQYTIIGIMAKEFVSTSWTLSDDNTYYVNCLENELSNDMWVKVNSEYVETTRQFSDHTLYNKVFDLTLPNFGSRLYVADLLKDLTALPSMLERNLPSNTEIEALFYKYSEISSYVESELDRISLKGATFTDITNTDFNKFNSYRKIGNSVLYLPETEPNNLETIHYKASRDRYINSLLRSNSDIGTLLEETYPDKVKGTNYTRTETGSISNLDIYYIPSESHNLLSISEIDNYKKNYLSYYVTDTISIVKGNKYTAMFNIDLGLYQNVDVETELREILLNYQYRFGIDFKVSLDEIKSLITKISNVKSIIDVSISYRDESNTIVTVDDINPVNSYFEIDYVINTKVHSDQIRL